MKKLKRGILALAAGQLLTLRRKDTAFKENIEHADSFVDKIKVAFRGLFDFNKEIVEELQSNNLSTTVSETAEKLKTEYTSLIEKAESLKSEYGNLTKEDWISKIDELKENNQGLIDTAKGYVDKVLENPEVNAIKNKANQIIGELKTIADETTPKNTDIVS